MTKYFSYYTIIILYFFTGITFSQTFSAKECIDMWLDEEEYSQQKIINDLFFNYDSIQCAQNLEYFERSNHLFYPKNKVTSANILIYRIYYLIRTSQLKENFDTVSAEIRQEIKEINLQNNQNLLGWLYFVYGLINSNEGNTEETLLYSLNSISIFEKLPYEAFPEKSNLYQMLILLLYEIEEYQLVIDYGIKCEKSLEVEGRQDSDIPIYLYDYLFMATYKLNQLSEAEKYLKKLEDALDKYTFSIADRNRIWKVVLFLYKGRLNVKKGKLDRALEKFDKALSFTSENESNVVPLEAESAFVLIEQGKIEQAEKKLLTAYQIAKENTFNTRTDQQMFILILKELERMAIARGNYKAALVYNKECSRTEIELYKDRQKINYRSMQALSKNEMFEWELKLYKEQQKNDKLMRWTLIIILILVILVSIYVFLTRKRKHRLQAEIREKEHQNIKDNLMNAEKSIHKFKQMIVQKNNIISQLSPTEESKTKDELQGYTILTERDWKEFSSDFNKVFPEFMYNLNEQFKNITPAELRLLCLAKLDLSYKEIASAQGISAETIRSTWHRFKKKYPEIISNQSLEDLVDSL